jgi:hypothetical protein
MAHAKTSRTDYRDEVLSLAAGQFYRRDAKIAALEQRVAKLENEGRNNGIRTSVQHEEQAR